MVVIGLNGSKVTDYEQIIFKGHLHWTAEYKYVLLALLMFFITIGLLIAGYLTERKVLYIIGAVTFVVAAILYVIERVIRTRCEFAVTNNRFIQKDGIFNVKMTEIPLFKIETVNFYQTFWQRILGTGSIELVGSGGTFHRLDLIKRPKALRKTIISAINNTTKREME